MVKNQKKKDVKQKKPTNSKIKLEKKTIPIDKDFQSLNKLCKSFINHNVKLTALFSYDKKYTFVSNCNAVGDILEEIFFERFKKVSPTIKVGPKQSSPDFWTHNKEFEYEMKVFTKNPSFDVSNFSSYISQLVEKNGVFRKLFQTKYIVFEYEIKNNTIIIKNFKALNVWNLVGYDGKYPISIQSKRNMWYNIRPSPIKDWSNQNKTPTKFVKNIIKAIKECPNNIQNKDKIINEIQTQFDNIKSKYNI